MINNITITAAQKDYKVDADLEKYILKKMGKLDRRMKRKTRDSARADVKIKENANKGAKKCTVEVILHTSDYKLTASESTMNMYAAVDIVEVKLQNQIKRYKEKHNPAKEKHSKSKARRAIGKIFSR